MAYGYAGLTNQATPTGTGTPSHGEWFVRDPAGKILSMVDATNPAAPSVTGYYLFDDQDSVMAIINPAATSATRYLYEPYGETIRTWTDPNPGTSTSKYTEDGTASAPAVDYNPWRYVSGYHDPGTGFLKFGTRYYMPAHATWTQPDPNKGSVNQPLTLNLFNYVGCSPSNRTDRAGRDWTDTGAELYALAAGCYEGAVGGGILGSAIASVVPVLGTVSGGTVGSTLGCAFGVAWTGATGYPLIAPGQPI